MIPPKAILMMPFPGYEWPLKIARSLTRSSDPAQLKQGVELLAGLTERYPTSLAVGQEYVFALIESRDESRAEQELARLESIFQGLDMELLCRWGRMFKDKGDFHSGSKWVKDPGPSNLDLAIAHYDKSIALYRQAYGLDGHYYPGINEASLKLIVAALKARRNPEQSLPTEVVELAEKASESRWFGVFTTDEDQKVWKPATRGEACLLMRQWGQADGYYREVLGDSRLTPHSRDSMRKQVHRVVEAFQQFGENPAAPFDTKENIDALFREDHPADSASTTAA